jgi:hypothetical protein
MPFSEDLVGKKLEDYLVLVAAYKSQLNLKDRNM